MITKRLFRSLSGNFGVAERSSAPFIIAIILALFFWCLAPGGVSAQEQKIIVTTSQQYQNMVRNASFESWSGGVDAAPDAWTGVNAPTCAKITADKMVGSSSLKVTASANGQGITSQSIPVDPNSSYTVSFYYKVDAGGSATFNVSGTAALINQTGLNSTSWKRMSYTFNTQPSDTSLTIKMTANGSYVFYIDGVMLTRGHYTPGFSDYAITDTGDQTVYGNITTTGTVDSVNISDFATTGSLDHTKLINIGTNSHGLIDTHIAGSSGVHGVTGSVVGTTDSQTLTNKTVHAVSDGLTVGTNQLAVANGKVGIGTANPQVSLHVSGTTAGNEVARFEGSYLAGESVKLANFMRNGGTVSADISYSDETPATIDLGTSTNHALTLKTNNLERIRILNDGKIGIGTENPEYALDVNGAIRANDDIIIQNSSGNIQKTGAGTFEIDSASGQSINLRPAGAGAMTLLSGGNIGIGTASPADKLDVRGNIVTPEGMLQTPYGGMGKYENKLLHSENFTNIAWTAANASLVANAVAPNGPLTGATTLTIAAAGPGLISQSVSADNSTVYTFSIWLKAGTSTAAQLELITDAAGDTADTQALALTSSWQRFSITKTTPASGVTALTATIKNTGAVGTTILLWGAQVEGGSAPGVYAKSTLGAVTPSNGIVSTGDIIMPSLKLSGGAITDTTGTVTVGSSNDLSVSGDLHVTGVGPHYISQGNVGIGTTDPQDKLQVAGNISVGSNEIKLADSGKIKAGTGADLSIYHDGANSFISNTTGYLEIASAGNVAVSQGNVGIGTADPQDKLQVAGNISVGSNNVKLADSGKVEIGSGADLTIYHDGTNSLISNTTGYIGISSAGNVAITSGNVGIGTTAPGARLDVTPTVTATTDLKGISSGLVYNGATAMTNYYGNYIAAPTGTGTITNKYALVTEATAGNVGIGTVAPTALLDVAGNLVTTNSGTITAAGSVIAGADKIELGLITGSIYGLKTNSVNEDIGLYTRSGRSIFLYTNDNTTPKLTVSGSGNVGIGTTSPWSQLEVVSSAAGTTGLTVKGASGQTTNLLNVVKNDDSAAFRIDQNGNAFVNNSLYVYGSTANISGNLAVLGLENSSIAGNVGIGTTNPIAKLDINAGGGTSATTGLIIQNQGSGATMAIDLSDSGLTSSLTKYYLYAGADAYWATAGSLRTPHLIVDTFESPTGVNLTFRPDGLTGAAGTYVSMQYYNGTAWQDGAKVANVSSGFGDLQLMPAGGNVGIGKTSPIYKLDIFGGDVAIRDATDLGSESLTNITLDSGTDWTATNDCSLVDAAIFTFSSGGASTLTQASADLAIPVVGSRFYKFTYTVSDAVGNPSASITNVFSVTPFPLNLTNGAQTIYFKTAAAPGNFVITSTLTAGQAFTLDNFSLKEVQGGDLFVNGMITGGGADGIKVLANGNVGIGTAAPAEKLDINGTLKIGTLEGMLKATAGTVGQAVSGTDYEPPITKGDLTAGSDKVIITGTATGALIGAGAAINIDESKLTLNNIGGTLGSAKGGTGWDSSGSSGITKVVSGAWSIATEGTDYLTESSASTLTNKTISASSNTISNLQTSNFAAGVVDTDTTLGANSDTRLPSQKATKTYVDAFISGLKWKQSVRVATTGAGTLATSFANGQIIDGKTLAAGDRILIRAQATGSENGIYVVNESGAPTRATDADTATEMKQATVFVEEGTLNGDTAWVCNNDAITLGTTALTFVQFSGAGTYSAGTGLTLQGNSFLITPLTASRALQTNASGELAASNVTAVELGYVSGVTSSIQTQIDSKQASDQTIAALANYNTNGLLTQTAPDTFTGRAVTGTANRITVTNGDGVSANPSIDIASGYIGQDTITTLGTIGTGAWAASAVADTYVADNLTIAAGTINNTPIGATTTSTGAFTDLAASGALTLPANSVTDAMVEDTITASNYVPLVGGVNVTGGLNIATTSGSVGIGTLSPGTALQVAGATGISIGEDKTSPELNTAGKIKLFSAGDNIFYTTFTAGTQTANADYTLPTALPMGTAFLKSTAAGALDWDTTAYAPVGAKYITQTVDPTLTSEQALSGLATGLLKVTTGTGVLSTAVAGTDYLITEVDGIIGNEVTNATNGTLSRSGAGTELSPYTLGINLSNANTWAGVQTFNANTRFPVSGIWDTFGNVGIGTITPGYKLEVNGTGYFTDNVRFPVSKGIELEGGVNFISSAVNYVFLLNRNINASDNAVATNYKAAQLKIDDSAYHFNISATNQTQGQPVSGMSEAMTILNTGNVGIGTPGPAGLLHSALGTITADKQAILADGTWNNSGVAFTGIKANITDTASAAASKLIDLQVGGSSKFNVDKAGVGTFSGTIAGTSLQAGADGSFVFAGRSRITSAADGNIELKNNASTDFGLLKFGGITSAFPALKRSGAAISVRLADDSADANFQAARFDTAQVTIGSDYIAYNTPALTGAMRLGNNTFIKSRNAANAADKSIIGLNASDLISIGADSSGAIFGGNVGIGIVVSPTEKLEVSGNVKSSGAIIGSITGMLKATSGTVAQAISGVDYEPPVVKGDLAAGSNKITIAGSPTDALIGAGATVDVNEANLTLNNIGGTLNNIKGGTGWNSSASTGLVKVVSGTWQNATVGVDYLTESSTNTLTNKTIDANGTGNSITNLETADFAANVVDTDTTLTANSDTRLPSQKATKTYIDTSIAGLKWKQSVRVATTASGTLATSFANGQTLDGKTLATGNRILLKNQATGSENGIYIVNASGAPTRAADADTDTEIKQATVFVEEGTVNADTAWVCNNDAITLGTTALTFAQFSGSGTYSAGTGLTLQGNSFLITPLTASRALQTNASGELAVSTVTAAELGYVSGVTSSIQTQLNNKQPLDSTLTSLAAYNTNGILTQTAPDTFTGRTITGTTNRVTVTNGDGVSANPSIDIASNYVGQSTITTLGTVATGTWNANIVADAYVADNLTITAGTINSTPIGAVTPSTGSFTNLTANGVLSLPANSVTDSMVVDTITASNYVPLVGGVNVTGGLNIATTSGNVGIGTTGPVEKLHVYGGQVLLGNHTTDRNNALSIRREEAGQYLAVTRVASDVEALWIRVDAETPRIQANNSDLILGSWTGAANVDALAIKATTGNVGIGTSAPTAALHLKAGTAAAGTAPLKFTSGVNLTAPEAGALEWDGTNLYVTQTTGPTRKTLAYALTLGAIGASPNANGMTIASQVLNLEPASANFGGVVTTGAQTLAGAKTLTGTATFNNATYSALFTGGNVGIGTATPTNAKLEVDGGLRVTGSTVLLGDVDLGDALVDTIRIRGTVKNSSPTLIIDQESESDIVDFRDSGATVFKIADGGAITAKGPLTVDTNTLYVNDATHRVGIGNLIPGTALDVTGTIRASNGLTVTAGTVSLPNDSITDAMVNDNITLTNITQIQTRSHADLTNIGTNTHAQLDTHLAGSSGVHGVAGSVVGTTDTQTLSNKTISAVSNGLTVGTNQLVVSGSNVGIGIASPAAKLQVSPTVTATTDLKGISSGLVYNGATAMTNYYGNYIAAPTGTGTITNKYALVTEAAAGNVGIGTTAPTTKLEVNGIVYSTSGGFKYPDGTVQATALASGGWTRTDPYVFVTTLTDNVGIGTATPTAKLDVVGGIKASNGLTVSAGTVSLPADSITDAMVSNTLTASNFVGSGSATNAVDLTTAEVAGSLPVANGGTGATTFSSNYLLKGNTLNPVLSSVIYDNGSNVGVGTATPVQKMHVAGNMHINDDLYLGAPLGIDDGDMDVLIKANSGWSAIGHGRSLYVEAGITDNGGAGYVGGNLYLRPGQPTGLATTYGKVIIADQGGNVGIGTTAPGSLLDVSGDANQQISIARRKAAAFDSSGYSLGALAIGGSDSDSGLQLNAAGIDAYTSEAWTVAAHGTYLRLLTTNNGAIAATEKVRIDNQGNVGIGATAPSQALELGAGKWLAFEGTTDDGYETILQVVDPTGGDKTITFPNATGTVAVSAASPLSLSASGAMSIANAAANGSTKGAATFAAGDFNDSSGNISIDYTNGQAASTSTKGFLTAADWNSFNSKQGEIPAGTTSQYYRGDKTWQTLNTTAVAEGTNLYYTDARVDARLDTAQSISGAWSFTNPVTIGEPTAASHATTKLYVDNAIAGLSWKEAVKSKSVSAQPASPASGDSYVLPASPTGTNWTGHGLDIAKYNGTAWVFEDAELSDAVFVDDEVNAYVFNGSVWVQFTGAGAYVWGAGLSNTGNTVNVGAGTGITVGADTISITPLTASRAVATDGSGNLTASGATSTELGYLSGVSSAVQTQINGKQATLVNSAGLMGALSDETGSGLAVFNNAPTITSPVIANINPGADFTLSQSAVVPFTSVNAGAVANTLYLKAGNVGMGTITPGAKLHVENSDTYFQMVQKRSGSSQALWSGAVWDSVGSFIGSNAYYSSSFNYIPNYTAASGIEFRESGNIEFFADAGLTAGVSYNPSERMAIAAGGNVGIGITNPLQKLQVAGMIESTTGGFKYPDGSTQTSALASGGWTKSGGTVYVTTTSDNVGIGTTGPVTRLTVDSAAGGWAVRLRNSDATRYRNDFTINSGGLSINAYDDTGAVYLPIQIDGSKTILGMQGNVGVGTANPGNNKLHVYSGSSGGAAYQTGGLVVESSGRSAIQLLAPNANDEYLFFGDVAAGNAGYVGRYGSAMSPANLMIYYSAGNHAFTGGNVGIGTTNPSLAKLQVEGGNILIDNNRSYFAKDSSGTARNVIGLSGSNHIELGGTGITHTSIINKALIGTNAAPINALDVEGALAVGASYSGTSTAPANGAIIEGNVGIGTTGPGAKLHIGDGTGNPTIRIDKLSSGAGTLDFYSGATQVASIQDDADEELIITTYGSSNHILLQPSGNVGIGTTSPGQKLNVSGNILATGYVSAASARVTNIVTNTVVKFNGTELDDSIIYDNGTNVGIGMTAPVAKLQVQGPGASTASQEIIRLTTGDASYFGSIKQDAFDASDYGGSIRDMVLLGVNNGWNIAGETDIKFTTYQGGWQRRMTIQNNGNVGIGTATPAEKLEVAGNIKLTGVIRQGAMGDVAEMMALSSAITTMPRPSDVVMIDRLGGIKLADSANSTSVVGVISTKPAHILMAELPNSVAVALSGTVPCKVTAENGPIYPGDLLTSSGKPGYAMKASPAMVGTIIGKALEPLAEGEGEILIFVTRQ